MSCNLGGSTFEMLHVTLVQRGVINLISLKAAMQQQSLPVTAVTANMKYLG